MSLPFTVREGYQSIPFVDLTIAEMMLILMERGIDTYPPRTPSILREEAEKLVKEHDRTWEPYRTSTHPHVVHALADMDSCYELFRRYCHWYDEQQEHLCHE